MKFVFKYVIFLLAPALVMTGVAIVQAQSDAPRMSKDELKGMLTDPNTVVIDVRRGKDWTSSEFKIQGAIHVDPGEYESWAENYPKDKKLVLYCA